MELLVGITTVDDLPKVFRFPNCMLLWLPSERGERERGARDDKQSNILYYSIKPHYSYPFHTCIYIFVSTSYVFILLHKPFISNHWSKKEAENNKSTQREREKREKTDTILVFCWVETTHSALAITIIVHS